MRPSATRPRTCHQMLTSATSTSLLPIIRIAQLAPLATGEESSLHSVCGHLNDAGLSCSAQSSDRCLPHRTLLLRTLCPPNQHHTRARSRLLTHVCCSLGHWALWWRFVLIEHACMCARVVIMTISPTNPEWYGCLHAYRRTRAERITSPFVRRDIGFLCSRE